MVYSGRISSLFNRRDVQLLSLLAFALVFNREGDRVPSGNEWIYLLYVYKAFHPSFLAGDWTFQEPTAGHAIFNWVAGIFTLIPAKSPTQSLSVVAWVGRVACWIACFIPLQRLARRFSIPPWMGWLGILLWLIEHQSLVSTEWIVGTFEAKCIAYACLLFAIDLAIDQKLWRAGILTGLAFTFHTAVGMWGGAGLGMAVLLNSPIRRTLEFSGWTILLSLPGLITSIPLIFGANAITPAGAKFLVTTALPGCLDPAAFPRIWPVVMFGLLGFAAVHAVWRWDQRPVRMLFQLEATTAAFFVFACVARAIGRFDWVELYPLRVFSVLVMLLFFWQLADVLRAAFGPASNPADPRPRAALVLAGIAAFMCIPGPGVVMLETLKSHLPRSGSGPASDAKPPYEDGDFRACCAWVSKNAPADALVIAPPWENDAYYLIQRPLIVNWHAPRYDRMGEWQARMEAMVGPLVTDPSAGQTAAGLAFSPDDDGRPENKAFYAALPTRTIGQFRRDYGRSRKVYFISPSSYPFQVVFESGGVSVYRLPDAGN